ncbi:hypothetical protein [Acaryochloris sp. IP29b_bin.148]|uniref:hypothetical protein n=1 Tax=Acaryochloris sp. IP29b_bin.148 TaxID=2969218 RepID=UPI00260A0CC8|nr:hypothetical protein [Acaryochloris sp. IP29b_bin.148]
MKSTIHTMVSTGIVAAIAAAPFAATATIHPEVPSPLQLDPVAEAVQKADVAMVYDSALTPTFKISATGLAQPTVIPRTPTPPLSYLPFERSMAVTSNSSRGQPRSSTNRSFDWMWMIIFVSFSGFIVWRFLTHTSSGNQRSNDSSWFDFFSHDSSSDSSTHSDYGNYSDSSDFGGGSSDRGGDGGDW